MTLEEFEIKRKWLQENYNIKKKRLQIQYALSNNNIKEGDIVDDHHQRILVETIGVWVSYHGVPGCRYYGPKLRKSDNKPYKSGEKDWVYQINIEKVTKNASL